MSHNPLHADRILTRLHEGVAVLDSAGHVPASSSLFLAAYCLFGIPIMGLALGLVIYVIAIYWSGLEVKIGLVVCISMPLVSAWANMLGGLLPLLSVYLGYNPAVTSAPLMTTVVDSSGLVIYFMVAASILQFQDTPEEETPLEKLIVDQHPIGRKILGW